VNDLLDRIRRLGPRHRRTPEELGKKIEDTAPDEPNFHVPDDDPLLATLKRCMASAIDRLTARRTKYTITLRPFNLSFGRWCIFQHHGIQTPV
jgi:DNA-directed RNA polymerase specialized sigma24 family protein